MSAAVLPFRRPAGPPPRSERDARRLAAASALIGDMRNPADLIEVAGAAVAMLGGHAGTERQRTGITVARFAHDELRKRFGLDEG